MCKNEKRRLKPAKRCFGLHSGKHCFRRRNLLCQLARTWFECSVIEEPFLRYTITNLLACSDWVPFFDKFSAKQATPTTTRSPARRTVNFSELSGRLPGHLWTGLRLPISFRPAGYFCTIFTSILLPFNFGC